jgi:hypothetical protein
VIKPGTVGRDWCRLGAGSSITPLGRGGLRPIAAGLIRPDTSAVYEPSARRSFEKNNVSSAARDAASYRCEY